MNNDQIKRARRALQAEGILRLLASILVVALATAAVLLMVGCGGGEPLPESTYQPVNCGIPGACL